jgi:transposase
MLDIPYDVRDEALQDLLKNYASNFEKGGQFDIKFKSRKDPSQSINVLSKYWNRFKTGQWARAFNNVSGEKKIPQNLPHTSRLIKTKINEYYISIPQDKPKNLRVQRNIPGDESQVVYEISLDPGVRKFNVGYDPQGLVFQFGSRDIVKLFRLQQKKNQLQSKISKSTKHRRTRNLRRAQERIQKRIENLQNDCHRKMAMWLCSNYNRIYIPKLDFHNFKNLRGRNKTKMILWKHCKFVELLKHKSTEFVNCQVLEVTEEYTSKTCSNCGYIHQELGASEIYKCPQCHKKMDRDFNGARGIYLKNCPK